MSESFRSGLPLDKPGEKVPMHPEDYVALLEWVRAKEKNCSAGKCQGNFGSPG